MWRKVIRALAMLVDRDERVGKGERVLTEVFASDPAVLEAVVMIRSSPLPGFNTRVVWAELRYALADRGSREKPEEASRAPESTNAACLRGPVSGGHVEGPRMGGKREAQKRHDNGWCQLLGGLGDAGTKFTRSSL